MIVKAVTTKLIKPNDTSLLDIIKESVAHLEDASILVISSKIVSLCEGSVVPIDRTAKDELITAAAQKYLPRQRSKYNAMITIVQNSLMLAAGIDESNSNGMYVLWPKYPLATAQAVREYCVQTFGLQQFGVMIVDSTSRPFRIGTIGTVIAHCGFKELYDYRGTKDLFGKEMTVSQANIAESLASAATVVMGEGTEQTPIAIITDVPFATFGSGHQGTCYDTNNTYEDDIYAPLWNSVDWHTNDADL